MSLSAMGGWRGLVGCVLPHLRLLLQDSAKEKEIAVLQSPRPPLLLGSPKGRMPGIACTCETEYERSHSPPTMVSHSLLLVFLTALNTKT